MPAEEEGNYGTPVMPESFVIQNLAYFRRKNLPVPDD
jgi:hypothetical protein